MVVVTGQYLSTAGTQVQVAISGGACQRSGAEAVPDLGPAGPARTL